MEKIREMLKQVVLECMYLDIDKDELVKIVRETYDKGQQVPNSQTKEENIW